MAIDIALYVRVHSQSNDVPNVRPNTGMYFTYHIPHTTYHLPLPVLMINLPRIDFGPAFWMTRKYPSIIT